MCSTTDSSTVASRDDRFALPRPAAVAMREAADSYSGLAAACLWLAALWIDFPDDSPADVRRWADFLFWADSEVPADWGPRASLMDAAETWLEAGAR